MSWYAAHAIMYVKFKDRQQDKYPMWENILLIEAQSDQDAMTKAIARAKEDEGDSEGTFTWEGRPATWCLGGIRKLVTCEFHATEPADGTEVTYLELEVSSQQDFVRFLNGETVMIKYNGGEEPSSDLWRFFYYPDVKEADYLFLGVTEPLYPELKREYIDKGRPRSLKENLLTKF